MKRRNFSKDRMISIGLFLLYDFGLVLGAIYLTGSEDSYFTYYLDSFLLRHSSGNFLTVFSYAFLAALGMNLLLLLCSLSCFGAPFILLLPLLRGLNGGMIIASLYLQSGGKGILFTLLVLWLPMVLLSLELLLFSSSALKNSGRMLGYAIKRKNGALLLDSIGMMQDFVLYASIGLAAALLEGLFAMLFGPVFSL